MAERKVLNKYYPPDFDPAKIPRRKQLKNLQMKVRMMLPMSVCCNTCGTFMYKGTKFNCRKEDVVGETYLGLMKFRFYFKCTKCSAELIMKTDPQNSDYEMEHGASRNFEPWREGDELKAAAKKQREEEEMGDAMKALENRTMDSRIEMDILAGLDEVKSLKARQANIDQDSLLEALKRSAQREQATEQKTEQELEEEDEKLIKSIVFRNSQGFVKRIEDDEEEEEDDASDEENLSLQRTGVLKPADVEAPRFTLQKSTGKRDISVNDVPDENGKRLKADSERQKIEAQSSVPANASIGTGLPGAKSASDTLLIKKVEESKPLFKMKPVKVAFAVKEKKKVPAAGVATSGPAKSTAERAIKVSDAGASYIKPTALSANPPSSTSSPAVANGSAGLALLSGYADSDEGSE